MKKPRFANKSLVTSRDPGTQKSIRAPSSYKAEKMLISDRESQKIMEKLQIWGRGGMGLILILNILKRIAQKLRRIILLHFGLVTFRIHFGMFFDLVHTTMTPATNYSGFLETPRYFKKSKNNPK